MKQAYAGTEPVEWHITAPFLQHVSFYVLMIHAGSLYISGKVHTYPSPKPTLILTSQLGQNVGLGEG